MNLRGAKVVVVGIARSGLAAVDLLNEKGAIVTKVDQNPAQPDVRPQTAAAFDGAELIVLSPGVPADLEVVAGARERGVRVIGDLELASWFLHGGIIGITGSNGKTTTTALTGHILQSSGIPAQVGGNIGTPPCSMVATSRADQWNVLEVSSFQLETTDSFHAKIGACLNVTPDHLDRHYTMQGYAEAKARLFLTQQAGDLAVLNADDEICRSYVGRGGAAPAWFSSTQSVTPGAWLESGRIVIDGQPLMESTEVPLRGVHNLENTMAAALMARAAGATLAQIRDAVRTFPGVEHRIEFVRELRGVAYYNDSKATNVDATLKSIAAFPGGLWIILGGKDKNSDYTPLAAPLREKGRAALLIGAAAQKIEQHLNGALPVIHCGTIDRAISEAHAHASRGETVLLAPACASFDQFQNYEHRGREFKRLVRELEKSA